MTSSLTVAGSADVMRWCPGVECVLWGIAHYRVGAAGRAAVQLAVQHTSTTSGECAAALQPHTVNLYCMPIAWPCQNQQQYTPPGSTYIHLQQHVQMRLSEAEKHSRKRWQKASRLAAHTRVRLLQVSGSPCGAHPARPMGLPKPAAVCTALMARER